MTKKIKTNNIFNDALFNIVNITSGIILGVLIIIVFSQVVARYILNNSFPWAEELPIFLFAWISFLGAACALREEQHLSVNIFLNLLPNYLSKILKVFAKILVLFFVIITVFNGIKFSYVLRNSTFVVMNISKSWYYLSLPIGGIFMIYFIFFQIINLIKFNKNIKR